MAKLWKQRRATQKKLYARRARTHTRARQNSKSNPYNNNNNNNNNNTNNTNNNNNTHRPAKQPYLLHRWMNS